METAMTERNDNPDAALLALGEKFEAAWTRQQIFVDETKFNDPDREHDDEIYEAFDRFSAVVGAIVDKILLTPAMTVEGMMVKARGISWCHCGDLSAEWVALAKREDTTDVSLLWSIALDLVAMTGQGARPVREEKKAA
jgi:hypothetical protein